MGLICIECRQQSAVPCTGLTIEYDHTSGKMYQSQSGKMRPCINRDASEEAHLL